MIRRYIFVVLLFITIQCFSQKKIAVFGGSIAEYFKKEGGQQKLEMMLSARITNFGKAGDGLCRQTYKSCDSIIIGGIPKMVEKYCEEGKEHYDVYIIWCSTNDIWGNPIGKSNDFTSEDGYDMNALLTQCGGLNYCIRRIREHSPYAKICIFASMKSFDSSYGYSRTGEMKYIPQRRMWDYVEKQIECANRASIPVLNLWTDSNIDEYNYKKLFVDNIHPSKEGYKYLCAIFARFLQNFLL